MKAGGADRHATTWALTSMGGSLRKRGIILSKRLYRLCRVLTVASVDSMVFAWATAWSRSRPRWRS